VEERQLRFTDMHCWTAAELHKMDCDITLDEFMQEEGLVQAIEQLYRYGLIYIKNVPTNSKAVEQVAERFGPIRETFYGHTFDVKSVPDAKNIAYTSFFLGLHMDLMYFEAPPGLQFLHCVENSVTGGESIFVDVYKAVETLRRDFPDDFKVLTEVPVTFHYINNGHDMKYRRPTIHIDAHHQPYQVYYAPPFQGPLETTQDVDRFYEAFKQFSRLIEDKSMIYQRRLEPGDCVIFANRRVLHGRQAFDGTSGHRHFVGTYVDWDALIDKYRYYKSQGRIPTMKQK
jgi:hypothetical protein